MTPEEKHAYDQKKNRLEMKVIARNLAEQSNGSTEKLTDAMKNVPVSKFLEQIQYLENVLLPKIEQNRGRESADYTFYAGLVDTLMWSITILDRYERLALRHEKLKVFGEYLQERVQEAERELSLYEAANDLLLSSTMRPYLEAAAKRIQNLKEQK